jgi:phosphoribosylformimino-5-aminoimidazole carboxamide ribonucleotide (ProFAR) isomerase
MTAFPGCIDIPDSQNARATQGAAGKEKKRKVPVE